MREASKQRKTELITALKRAILTQELLPGADLDEVKLCEQYDLSRTPLREVLRYLAGIGYVELRENRGGRVSELSHDTLRNFFIAAPMIYGAILQLAASSATPVQIRKLKEAQKHFVTAMNKRNAAERSLANNRFHEITGDMANNQYLLPSFNRLLIDHARIGIQFYDPADVDNAGTLKLASQQHDQIITAIETHNPNDAKALAHDHWNLSRNQIERFVMPQGIDAPLGTTSTIA
ncbi:MAG: GntR family transcriptional regulator [Granulosicoccaceae bacterium]